MSTFALVDATTYVHGHNFTTDLNQIQLSAEMEALNNTAFGNGGHRSRTGGLKTVSSELNGFWQEAPDEAAFSDLGVADRPVTMTPDGVETSVAYMYQAGNFSYSPFGAIGEVTPFSLSMQSTNQVGLVRGQLASRQRSVSATGQLGSPVNLGAVGSDQYLYGVVHVFSIGTSVELAIESAADSSFGTPTTQATIGPLTATGATWVPRVPGSISDTWFRLTVTAITGTLSLAGALAVQ